MIKNIEMVVFDMAGTTVNEGNIVYKTLQEAIMIGGFEDVTLELVLELGAGKEKFQAIEDILDAIAPEKTEKAIEIFDNFKIMLDEAYSSLDVQPIDGTEVLLLELRSENIKVVLNTGYNSKVANLLLEKLHWDLGVHYDLLITADDVEKGRPHPDMILKAMKHFNIDDASKVLKAGDSAIDIEEGKNANCGITVGVLSGAQTEEQLEEANPSYILQSINEIHSIY